MVDGVLDRGKSADDALIIRDFLVRVERYVEVDLRMPSLASIRTKCSVQFTGPSLSNDVRGETHSD